MRKAYFRLFSDQSGASHLETLEAELTATPYAPPAPDVFLSRPMPAAAAVFLSAPAGWSGTWHVSPRRQLFVVLSGEIEVEMSDGTVERSGPGTVALLEDTTGRGHMTRVIGENAVEALVVPLA
jgi:quercetin dioxygenase-like cupin family protein